MEHAHYCRLNTHKISRYGRPDSHLVISALSMSGIHVILFLPLVLSSGLNGKNFLIIYQARCQHGVQIVSLFAKSSSLARQRFSFYHCSYHVIFISPDGSHISNGSGRFCGSRLSNSIFDIFTSLREASAIDHQMALTVTYLSIKGDRCDESVWTESLSRQMGSPRIGATVASACHHVLVLCIANVGVR